MGNCGTKPKTSDGDDAAPPPAEAPTPAGAAVVEQTKDEEVAAVPEEASQVVVAPPSEEATTTAAKTKECEEPMEKAEVPKEEAGQGNEETPTTEVAGELPASTPASVA